MDPTPCIFDPEEGRGEREKAVEELLEDEEKMRRFGELGVKFLVIRDLLRQLADISKSFREGRVGATNVAEVETTFLSLLDRMNDFIEAKIPHSMAYLVKCIFGQERERMKVVMRDLKTTILDTIGEHPLQTVGMADAKCQEDNITELSAWLGKVEGLGKLLLKRIRGEEGGEHLWILETLDWEIAELGIEKVGKDLLDAIEGKDTAKIRQLFEDGLNIILRSDRRRFLWAMNEKGRLPLLVIMGIACPERARVFFEYLILFGYCTVAEEVQKEITIVVTERFFDFAIMKGHTDILMLLFKMSPTWKEGGKGEKYLCDAMKTGQKSIVNILFEYGARILDKDVFKHCLEQAVEDGHLDCVQILLSWDSDDLAIINIFDLAKLAAQKGHRDIFRYLLIELGIRRPAYEVRLALSNKVELPLPHDVDYMLSGQITEKKIGARDVTLDQRCLHTHEMPLLPGYGDVRRIPGTITKDCADWVEKIMSESFVKENFIEKYHIDPIQVMRCGSSGEGTKVGLPDEMDYQILLEIDPGKTDMRQFDRGHGYKKVDLHNADAGHFGHRLVGTGSEIFHNAFIGLAMTQEKHKESIKSTEQFVRVGGSATAEWTLRYNFDQTHSFDISVDRVPVLYIKEWPPTEDDRKVFVMKTWKMDNPTLKKEGYALVAKPPHRNSAFAKPYESWKLQRMWQLSFGHLETKHLKKIDTKACLDQRMKDVYITCKSLRDPDICRILFKDSKGMYMSMNKDLITSYMLKIVFMHNVEEFRRDIEESRREVEESRRDIEESRREVEEFRRDVEESRREVEEFRRDVEESRREVEEFRRNVEESRPQVKELRRDVEESRREVEEFRRDVEESRPVKGKSLVEMVYMVYSQLSECISQWFLPLYWNPTWNQLEGLKLDRKQTTEATRIMMALATARFLRDGEAATVMLEAEDPKKGGVYPHLPSRSQSAAGNSRDGSLRERDDDVVVSIYSRKAGRASCDVAYIAYNVFQLE